jgi:hypothetical protein
MVLVYAYEKLKKSPAKKSIRGLGRAGNVLMIAYGVYMAGIEAQCGCYCIGKSRYTPPGIPASPAAWATEQARKLIEDMNGLGPILQEAPRIIILPELRIPKQLMPDLTPIRH